jgi:hypothetical protein
MKLIKPSDYEKLYIQYENEIEKLIRYVREYEKARPRPDDSVIPMSLLNSYRALSDETRACIEEEVR